MKCVYKTETTVILAAILQVAVKANYITIIYCMKNVFRFLNCQKKNGTFYGKLLPPQK